MTAQLPLQAAQELLRRAEEAIGDRCYRCGLPVTDKMTWTDGFCSRDITRKHQISGAQVLVIVEKEAHG